MFSYYYNYILFFFNYELIVLVCFFLFFFFILISEKGQLGKYLQELSIETRSKLLRHLSIRETVLLDLDTYLNRSVVNLKKIVMSYEKTSNDILLSLQYTIKKLAQIYITLQVKYFHDIILMRTQYLLVEIKRYFTQDLFVEKSYDLTAYKTELKNKKYKITG